MRLIYKNSIHSGFDSSIPVLESSKMILYRAASIAIIARFYTLIYSPSIITSMSRNRG